MKKKKARETREEKQIKETSALAGKLSWLEHHLNQGCRFDFQSGHTQEPTNECINKWDNKLMSS